MTDGESNKTEGTCTEPSCWLASQHDAPPRRVFIEAWEQGDATGEDFKDEAWVFVWLRPGCGHRFRIRKDLLHEHPHPKKEPNMECCFIGPHFTSPNHPCTQKATWNIVFGSAPHHHTQSCDEHVGALMGDEVKSFQAERKRWNAPGLQTPLPDSEDAEDAGDYQQVALRRAAAMTDGELDNLETLDREATSEPWDLGSDTTQVLERMMLDDVPTVLADCYTDDGPDNARANANAALIAAMRNALPALIADSRALAALRKAMKR